MEIEYMLNWIWGIMIVSGTIYGILTGNGEAVGVSVMDGAKEAISLAITMAGIMGFWCGLMEIAEKSGIMQSCMKVIRPFIQFLFPNVPKEHPAFHYISVNFVANMFGLSGAATPSGIKAMEYLQELNPCGKKDGKSEQDCGKNTIASKEMCTFLVMNVSSLQLIPISILAFRTQYGSVNPSGIVVPALIATFVSALLGVIFCKCACMFGKR